MNMAFLLAKHTSRRFCPENMKWMWGQGLYNYALSLIDEAHGTDDYTEFLCRYYNAHLKQKIKIESSDTAAPALGAYMLWKKTGNEEYKRIAEKAVSYMLAAKRALEHLPNHLGTGFYSKIYPQSVWIDSIMMYGVFAARFSGETGNSTLAEFARRQAPLFEKYLRNEKYGLYSHSYWTKLKTRYPRGPVFWGRGNGWIMAAMPLMLPFLEEGEEKEKAVEMFKSLSYALLPYQREDGFFETLLRPGGISYKEASATALIASGLIYGGRTGLLDEKCLDAGRRAHAAVVNSIREDKQGLCLPDISAPTIPMPPLPVLGYMLTPKGNNLTYGLAALIFSALQEEKLS